MLHIRLLGAFVLTYDGEEITSLRSARVQSLLSYLVLHADAPQSRQSLAHLFWPDSEESQARSNLRKLFSQLRRALPNADHFLRYNSRTIQWNPDAAYTIDVASLRRLLAEVTINPLDQDTLVKVVEYYQGELLPSCHDDWSLVQRQQLQHAVLAALEQLVTLLENRHAYDVGIRFAQRLLDLDPLTETSYQRLMRLRALSGDRSGALRIYYDCVTMLRQTLAVEPSPETQQIYERILNKEVTALPPTAVIAEAIHLVGRVSEWETLKTAWQKAAQGMAQLATLMGEAGIGKTRLAEELLSWAGYHGISTARTRSYVAQGALAYTPIAELLRTQTLRPQLAKLDQVWLGETARLLPELLSTYPELPAPQPIIESGQRRHFFEALARSVLVTEQPLILLLDDLQWCDRETLEWLQYLLHFASTARLLVVGTVRSEELNAEHPFTALQLALRRTNQLTDIALSPLSSEDTATLAAQIAGGDLTAVRAEHLYQETEGNPLFIVEMMRAQKSQASETSVTAGPSVPAVESGTLTVLPPKIYDVIHSRLLQLSPQARELTNLAAVIGRSFTYEVVLEASDQDEDTLVNSLDELWQRRIVREQGVNGYDFSHDRFREVAYTQISHTRRRFLHRRVAQTLEKLHKSAIDAVTGEIAGHYEQAGRVEQCLPYYQHAARVSQQIGAYHEAAAYLRKGLHLLKSLPHSPASIPQELAMLVPLGACLIALRGYGDPEVESIYRQAHQLCTQLGDDPNLMPILMGLALFYMVRGELQQALVIGQQSLLLAQRTQDTSLLLEGHLLMGAILLYLAQFRASRSHLEQAVALYDPASHSAHAAVYGQEPGVTSQAYLAVCLWYLGYADRSLSLMQDALALAHQVSHQYTLGLATFFVTWVHHMRQEPAAVQAITTSGEELARQHGFQFWLMLSIMHQGWAAIRLHAIPGENPAQTKKVLVQMQEALSGYQQTGASLARGYYLGVIAEGLAMANEFAAGLVLVDEALALVDVTHERSFLADMQRLRGELLLAQTGTVLTVQDTEAEAEAAFLQAMQTAQAQDARILELRSAKSLARLWARQDRHADAYALLKPVFDWFTEGFDTPDLQEATALLASLE